MSVEVRSYASWHEAKRVLVGLEARALRCGMSDWEDVLAEIPK